MIRLRSIVARFREIGKFETTWSRAPSPGFFLVGSDEWFLSETNHQMPNTRPRAAGSTLSVAIYHHLMIDITRRRLPYVLMDVFTDRPLEGNQLAVITDARGLTTEQMQAIAREMNLSETTFIFPRELEEERSKGTRVRIFTTQEELPFAGHPTLGTSYFLHRFGGNDEIWL